MKFGTEVLKGLSERERHENRLSKNHTSLKDENQFIVINVLINYCLLGGVKFDIDRHIMLWSNCDFRENTCTESHTLLKRCK